MKSNNKLHPVFNYLLDCIDFKGSDAEKIHYILIAFNSEYNHDYNKKYYPNLQKRFSEWLKGLPSCINVDFENYKILEIAKTWESLPINATERQEDKILSNWFDFITVKFFQLCKRNKVDYSYVY